MAKRIVGLNDRGLRVGQDHQRAKLTDAAVEMIRRLHEEGLSYRVIALKFEIAKSTVQDICTYRRRAQTPSKWRTTG